MINNVKEYLNTAAGIKKGIKQQSWMGFGMLHLANNRRATLYWFLAFVVFLLMAVYAGVEDFPGGVKKPLEVRLFDFGSRLAELLMEIAHGVVATGRTAGVGVSWLRCSDRQGVSDRKNGAKVRGKQFQRLLQRHWPGCGAGNQMGVC